MSIIGPKLKDALARWYIARRVLDGLTDDSPVRRACEEILDSASSELLAATLATWPDLEHDVDEARAATAEMERIIAEHGGWGAGEDHGGADG